MASRKSSTKIPPYRIIRKSIADDRLPGDPIRWNFSRFATSDLS